MAVVGAGVAGIAAAVRLRQSGLSVALFDKGRAAGGRVATRRRDGAQFDHGAQFFTVRDASFAKAIEPLVADGSVQEWRGPFRTLANGVFGPDPRPGVRYVGAPGMSALPRALAQELDVTTNARVVALRRDKNAWSLVVEDERGLRAERSPYAAVLLALPPEQAAALLDASQVTGPVRDAAFAARDALQPCVCAMATFARPVDDAEGGMFVTDEALSWASHDGGKPQRNGAATYVLHATAKWSSQNFERDPLETARELVAAFSRSLGAPLPDVVALDAHRWRYAIANEAFGNAPSVVDADARLGLAVDALAGGRVEGAWLSGRDAAERMLRALAV